MTGAQILVLAGAVGLIAAIVWWFFFPPTRGSVARISGAGQEVTVRVAGGYAPSTIRARAGLSLRLVFDRREDSACSEEVVVPDFGVRRFLPAHSRTTVELLPAGPGTHAFTCGMGMLQGRIIVEEAP
jgi:plastocyanin domain-containing protein